MLDQRPTEVAMIPGNPKSRLSILQKLSVWKDGKYSLHDNLAHTVKIFSFLNDHLSKVGGYCIPSHSGDSVADQDPSQLL